MRTTRDVLYSRGLDGVLTHPAGRHQLSILSLLLDGNRREQLSGAAEMINSLWKGRLPEAVAHTPPNGPRARDFKDVAALDSFTA